MLNEIKCYTQEWKFERNGEKNKIETVKIRTEQKEIDNKQKKKTDKSKQLWMLKPFSCLHAICL